ncbi:MAG: hypothetical protein KDA77_00380 [Planctomycetaceae bacterium]|nr:hypothetical protein [Planctomycetaceae bacterium]
MGHTPIDKQALLTVLQQCRELTLASNDSDWSWMDVPKIIDSLDRSIRILQESRPLDLNELRFLFAPTGPLQETSMSNNWSDEFLLLAEQFDNIIGESS